MQFLVEVLLMLLKIGIWLEKGQASGLYWNWLNYAGISSMEEKLMNICWAWNYGGPRPGEKM